VGTSFAIFVSDNALRLGHSNCFLSGVSAGRRMTKTMKNSRNSKKNCLGSGNNIFERY